MPAPLALLPGPVGAWITLRQQDAESGLVYLRARHYDPAAGRFLQPDSYLGRPDAPATLHRYAYVLNNPLRYTDPSGHSPCDELVYVGGRLVCSGDDEGSSELPDTCCRDYEDDTYVSPEVAEELESAFAKGGKQKGENEYTRDAKEWAQRTGRDPCIFLAAKMQEAQRSRDTARREKIKQAQKFLNCRHHG